MKYLFALLGSLALAVAAVFAGGAGFPVTQPEAAETAAEPATAFTVAVRCGETPLEGAMIQFCDDKTCTLLPTGADGTAVFEMPEGTEYEVHVLMAPAGYEGTSEVFHTGPRYGELVIELKAK